MSDSLWPHGLQHAKPLCLLLSPRVCSNSSPLHTVNLDKYIMICDHHHGFIQSHFSALKMLCTLPTYPFLESLATTDLLTVSLILPFPDYHMVGIIECVAFSDYLLLLNNMYFLLAWIVFCSLNVPQFIYLFTYWGTFLLLPNFGNYL